MTTTTTTMETVADVGAGPVAEAEVEAGAATLAEVVRVKALLKIAIATQVHFTLPRLWELLRPRRLRPRAARDSQDCGRTRNITNPFSSY